MTREPVRQSCGFCLTGHHLSCLRERPTDRHGVAWRCACTHPCHTTTKENQ